MNVNTTNTKVKYIIKFKAKNLCVHQDDVIGEYECVLDNSNKEFVLVRDVLSFGEKFNGIELVDGDSYLNLISDQVEMYNTADDAEYIGLSIMKNTKQLADTLLRVESFSVIKINVEEKITHSFNLNSMREVANITGVS